MSATAAIAMTSSIFVVTKKFRKLASILNVLLGSTTKLSGTNCRSTPNPNRYTFRRATPRPIEVNSNGIGP